MVLSCYYYVMINWMAFDFLLLIFELFADLVKVMSVICGKNTSCYSGLNSYDEIIHM